MEGLLKSESEGAHAMKCLVGYSKEKQCLSGLIYTHGWASKDLTTRDRAVILVENSTGCSLATEQLFVVRVSVSNPQGKLSHIFKLLGFWDSESSRRSLPT